MEPRPSLKITPKGNASEEIVNIQAFWKEIAALKLWRQTHSSLNTPTSSMAGLGGFEILEVVPEDLTPADAKMWQRVIHYEDRPVTQAEFDEYNKDVKASGNISRKSFRGVIATQLSSYWLDEGTMERFREEIDHMFAQRKIMYRDREGTLEAITSRQLTRVDAAIWYKLKNYTKGSVTRKDIEEYQKDVAVHRNLSRDEFKLIVIELFTNLEIKVFEGERIQAKKARKNAVSKKRRRENKNPKENEK